jgi:hypothetical protein
VRRLLLCVALAGCGSAPDQPPPVDEVLRRDAGAARAAYRLERPAEAATQYQAALQRAQARDDLPAITDAGFDLGVAQLRADDPTAALRTARALRAELARRDAAPLPALALLEATALFRLNRVAEADTMAELAETGGQLDVAARAAFLRGLIADGRGDVAGLRAAAARVEGATAGEAVATGEKVAGNGPTSGAVRGDAGELRARVDLRVGDAAAARAAAMKATEVRRAAMDYRGLARTLALAGAAADLYLRAGCSAASQGNAAAAAPWLAAVRRLATDPAVVEAAAQAQATIAEP